MLFNKSRNSFFDPALELRYRESGSWPEEELVEVTKEVYEEYKGNPPQGMQRGSDEKGFPTWVPIPPADLETLAERKRAEIGAARDAAFAEGLPRDINGEPDVVQTRPQDQINLLGLRAKAEAARDGGITEPVMKFRGENNVTRYLTPDEMYALTNDALAHIESIYDHSWECKDSITAAKTNSDRVALKAVTW